jgi:hypothetical protein
MTNKLIVLDPTISLDDAPAKAVTLAPRLSTLEGKVIGCLWNNRYQGDMILEGVVTELRAGYRIKDVVFGKKDYIGESASKDLIEKFGRSCDAVVLAVGD